MFLPMSSHSVIVHMPETRHVRCQIKKEVNIEELNTKEIKKIIIQNSFLHNLIVSFIKNTFLLADLH